jgi:hypothetical protein
MHRISAGLLIALFGLSLMSPAVFASGDDSNLPACCRRAGKHHCSMLGADPSAGPSLRSAPCPLFPSAPNIPANRIVTFVGSRPPVFAGMVDRSAECPEVTSISRISYHRPGEKRGPPVLLS